MRLLITLTILSLAIVASSGKKSYSGYSVYRVHVENEDQAKYLHQLQKDENYDFWNGIRIKGPVDIMASPSELKHLARQLNRHGLNFEVMIPDVQPLMDDMMPKEKKKTPRQGHNMDWTSYHDLEDIMAFLNYTADTYAYASTQVLGKTYEGRDIVLMKLCNGGCGNKPALFIDSAMHSNEWVAPATTTYLIHMLTEMADGTEDFITMLDWYILPVANPDGYEYSWTDDRNWRKSRSFNQGSACLGTDIYHNFGYHWGDGDENPCSIFYHGTSPDSEIETRAIQTFLDQYQYDIEFYECVHSYGQQALTPWGFTYSPCPNYDDMVTLATKAAEALHIPYGTEYEVGCLPCIIGEYSSGGSPVDYVMNLGNIKYVYDLMLRDTGEFGNLLPPNQIEPTVVETWYYHLSVARDLIDEFSNK